MHCSGGTISGSMDLQGSADLLAPVESWLNAHGLFLLGVHQRNCVQRKGRVSSWFAPKDYSSYHCSALLMCCLGYGVK
jgi:hypothetical protein